MPAPKRDDSSYPLCGKIDHADSRQDRRFVYLPLAVKNVCDVPTLADECMDRKGLDSNGTFELQGVRDDRNRGRLRVDNHVFGVRG